MELTPLCVRLLEYDGDIVEIIQVGSSVYAPELAIDIDLLVFTRERKDYGGYLDAADSADLPLPVDVIVKEVGEGLPKGFALQAFGAYRVLHGDGSLFRRAAQEALGEDASFEEAWAAIKSAETFMQAAALEADELVRDRCIRSAFNELFHASRIASMAYLAVDEMRWGRLKGMLPADYRRRFESSSPSFTCGIFTAASIRGKSWMRNLRDGGGRLRNT